MRRAGYIRPHSHTALLRRDADWAPGPDPGLGPGEATRRRRPAWLTDGEERRPWAAGAGAPLGWQVHHREERQDVRNPEWGGGDRSRSMRLWLFIHSECLTLSGAADAAVCCVLHKSQPAYSTSQLTGQNSEHQPWGRKHGTT